MQTHFQDKVRFVKLDWNSEEGKEASSQADLKNPPISVLIDSSGEIVEKFEGSKSSKEMSRKLKDLLRK